MFVGVGASRVRDLFEQAKENAPAIVFIDEIDAVGRHRGAGMGGGHDEREQTLNQLLVEMDGFDVRGGVILIAATNRPDVLDPALLRPGRFDRMIGVDAPDMKGRHKILQVHSRGKPIAVGVDLLAVARRTPGFTGADLANVLNEAALLTARQDRKLIDERSLDEAIDRVSMGPQRHSHIMSEQEKLMTAYHEGGHALVAAALPGTDPVAKITILPRGRALGFTQVLPETDKSSVSRNDLLNQLAYALGGLAAEQLIFHDPTTGSSSDIEKATGVARRMVTSFGMSERIGAVKLGEDTGEPFLGRDFGHTRNYSEEIAAIIDEEISSLMTNAHQEAFDILVQNRAVLDNLVTQLLERETIDRNGLEGHLRGDRQMRAERPAWTGSDSRIPSRLPPGRGARARAGGRRARRPRSPSAPAARAASSLAAAHGAADRSTGGRAATAGRSVRRPVGQLLGLTRVRRSHSGAVGTRHPAVRPRPGRGRRTRAPASPSVRTPSERASRTRRPGSLGRTPRSSAGCGCRRRTCSRRPSTSDTTRWSWSRTSRSGRCASTTWSRSTGSRMWATSPARTAGSPGCPSWPGWWTSSPGGRRSRSG